MKSEKRHVWLVSIRQRLTNKRMTVTFKGFMILLNKIKRFSVLLCAMLFFLFILLALTLFLMLRPSIKFLKIPSKSLILISSMANVVRTFLISLALPNSICNLKIIN